MEPSRIGNGSSVIGRLQQNSKAKPVLKTSVRKILFFENSSCPAWALLDFSQTTPKPSFQRGKTGKVSIFSSIRHFVAFI